jgi:hypothetical protein
VTARRSGWEVPFAALAGFAGLVGFVASAGFEAGSGLVAGGALAPVGASDLGAGDVGVFVVAAASASGVAPSSVAVPFRTFCFQPSEARGFAVGASGGCAVAGFAIKAQAATHAPVLAANHRPCGIIFMV